MKYTQNLNMKIPEGGDPIDIADITENFGTLDTEIAKKANATGGDISNTTIKTVDTIATEFPVPSAGESSKTFLGKVKKFVEDFNNFKSGILTLGRLVNNGQTTEPGLALDARYGKTLYDLYAQLNSNLMPKSIGNAVANAGWEVIASNITINNAFGMLYGKITYRGAGTPSWGSIVGTFPNYHSGYSLPILLWRTSGDLCLTATVDTLGAIRLYNPDLSKIVTGKEFHFQASYIVG